MSALPQPSSAGAYVDITLIPAGSLYIPDYMLHANGTKEELRCVDYAFLIEHKTLGKKAFFDLGISKVKDLSIYPPNTERVFKIFKPTAPEQNLADVIQDKKGISADQIDLVIFSHVHWDHCHPPSSYLPNATVLFGPGSVEGVRPEHPNDPNSAYFAELWDPSHPWAKNAEELPPRDDEGWKPFGMFERAWDLYGDGSLWIIDAPGHVQGNLAAAGRLKSGEWIVMGGDCAHSRQLLFGREIGTWRDSEGSEMCMHLDKAAARHTLQRLRKLSEMKGVHIALAHVSVDELDDKLLRDLII